MMFKKNKRFRTVLPIVLVLILLFSLTSPALAADSLTEVQAILEAVYVDPVGGDVLSAPSIEETIERLGDPHTRYFTAAEFQDFINSIENTFSGIGIYLDTAPEGILVTSVIEGSPSEEVGLEKGDIITQVNGSTLEGKSMEYAQSLIKGEEGTSVKLTIKRGEKSFQVDVTRRKIEIPTVTGEVFKGHIGYIAINSFGTDTSQRFDEIVKELKNKDVDSWIIDLQDNPGGYMETALELAGVFIGNKVALQTQDRSGKRTRYPGYEHGYILEKPIILLVNNWSASSSEILASAVRDYDKALIIGTNTYGKGTVQSLYELSDGGALKVTTSRFYSALGQEINGVGVKPDLPVEVDAKEAAGLLLEQVGKDITGTNEGYLKVAVKNEVFVLNAKSLQLKDNWQAGQALLDGLAGDANSQIQRGTGSTWSMLTNEELKARWSLYYPGYKKAGDLNNIPLTKKFTVTFSAPFRFDSVNPSNVELIEVATGDRKALSFLSLSDRSMEVLPNEPLKAGETYWLVIHNSILDANGNRLKGGAVAIATTEGEISSSAQKSTMLTQRRSLKDGDYGAAIIQESDSHAALAAPLMNEKGSGQVASRTSFTQALQGSRTCFRGSFATTIG